MIYNRELNKFKIEFLNLLKRELEDIKLFKLRKKSNAYEEINKLILNMNNKIYSLSDEVIQDNTISTIKVENHVLDELFKLKRELDIATISELLNSLAINYNHVFLIDKLTEIKDININKKLEFELNKMNFYVCTNIKNVKDKILYKIDDIIIIENLKYLNLEEFKEYSIGNEIFYISPTFTLRDIDLFISILKNTNYTNEI